MHNPLKTLELPGIDPRIVGDIPDAHARRVVAEMLDFLNSVSNTYRAQLVSALSRPIGGNPKAQRRWADRVNKSTTPILVDFETQWGKRARFNVVVSVWVPDDFNGATVWCYLLLSEGPGTEQRKIAPFWRFSQHALTRLVQRSGATDAAKLMHAMRKVAVAVADGMTDVKLMQGDGKVLHLKFDGGCAVVEWPENSELAVVKTILGPDMRVPLPGLHS